MIDGETFGVEAWAAWQVTPNWRLNGGLTLLREHLRVKPGSTDPVGPSALGNDPTHQWMLRSAWDVTPTVEVDMSLRRVGRLPDPAVAAYSALDMRVGWQPRSDLSLSLVGKNLLDGKHPEFGSAPGRSEIARSLHLQATWSF
jgi:iron complex outermembrane receptor protein